MKNIILIIISCLFVQHMYSQSSVEKNLKSYFEKHGVEGCFVLYNQGNNEFIRYNTARCDTGYIPASTFKIPHSVIVLEEGIITDTNQIIKWDGVEHAYGAWNKDQTLKTAMKYSCVPVYVGFAEQLGIDKYYEYVNAFDYGNKDLTGPPTRFWLVGSFKISANQQIDFLRRFYNYELPVLKQSIDVVKNLIVLEETSEYKLSGKTGGGMISETDYVMWLVGYLEKDGDLYFYALNFTSDDFNKTKQARYEITKDILRTLNLME